MSPDKRRERDDAAQSAQQREIMFGDIAVEMAVISPGQLTECRDLLRKVAEMGLRKSFEEVLLERGYATKKQIVLIRREMARRGVLPKIGSYELISKLGQGGMGIVYLARETSRNRPVALKVLRPDFARDRHVVRRFRREARLAAQVLHPNLVEVYEIGTDGGLHFIAMEYIGGTDAERLIAQGPLPERRALLMVLGVARGLEAAHKAGIVHRDVKPGNILLTPEGVPKLADLGLARDISERGDTITRTGALMGSPGYMAPEQWSGGKKLDGRADVYALGVTLFQLLCGRLPFEGDTPVELMRKHLEWPLPDPRMLNPHLSEGVCRLIGRMMARDADQRIASARKLIDEIAALISGPRVQAATTILNETPLVLDDGEPAVAGVSAPTPVNVSAEDIQAPHATPVETLAPAPAEVAPVSYERSRKVIALVVGALAVALAVTAVALTLRYRARTPPPKGETAVRAPRPGDRTGPRPAPPGAPAAPKPAARPTTAPVATVPVATPPPQSEPRAEAAAGTAPAPQTTIPAAPTVREPSPPAAVPTAAMPSISDALVPDKITVAAYICSALPTNDLTITPTQVWGATDAGAFCLDLRTGETAHWRERDGFPCPGACSVAADPAGNVWFGALNDAAVVRYNGKTFEKFPFRVDSKDGPCPWTRVFVTRGGQVLRIAPVGPPQFWDGRNWVALPGSPPGMSAKGIAELPSGGIIVVETSRLAMYVNHAWSLQTGPQNAAIDTLACDHEGNVWAGSWTTDRVYVLGKGAHAWVEVAPSRLRPAHVGFAGDADGRVWMADQANRLVSSAELGFAPPGHSSPLRARLTDEGRLFGDAAGGLWVTPDLEARLARFDVRTGKGQDYVLKGDVTSRICDVALDSQDQPWLAARRGLWLRTGTAWQSWLPSALEASAGAKECFALCFDPAGQLWLGWTKGVSCFKQRRLRVTYSLETLMEGQWALGGRIGMDGAGSLWVLAPNGGGMASFSGARWSRTGPDGPQKGGYPTRVAVDRSGRPFFYSVGDKPFNRCWQYVGSKFVARTVGPPDGSPAGLAWNPGNEEFVLLKDGRICRETPAGPVVVADLPGEGRALAVDQRGWLWAGNSHGRIHVWPELGKPPMILTGKNGLPGGPVEEIRSARDGSVWVLQSGGLAQATPAFKPAQ